MFPRNRQRYKWYENLIVDIYMFSMVILVVSIEAIINLYEEIKGHADNKIKENKDGK